jgi:hypothetical protein
LFSDAPRSPTGDRRTPQPHKIRITAGISFFSLTTPENDVHTILHCRILLHFEVSPLSPPQCRCCHKPYAISHLTLLKQEKTKMIRFSSRVKSAAVIGSVLLSATGAFISSGEANTGSTDDTTRVTIAMGKFVSPSEMIGVLTSFSETKMAAVDSTELRIAQDSDLADTATGMSDAFVTVMSAPSEQSRTIAELRHGQAIKVLKAKDSWLKITWQTDNTLSQGWLEKSFVDGKTIHAHR